MAVLSRDQILAFAGKRETERVPVPELGGDVIVQALNGRERDQFEADSVEQKGKSTTANLRNIRARLVAATVVDESGKRLFSKSDVEKLGEISASALDRIFSVARRLSGLSDDDVEELTENLDEAQGEDSTID